MPRAKPNNAAEAVHLQTQLIERKRRQAQQAAEGSAAMADYLRAADKKLERMIELRTERLKRNARAK